MATETKEKTNNKKSAADKFKNLVRIEGYLKENTLEIVTDAKGQHIRGNLTIAVDEVNTHVVGFYVNKFYSTGTENKNYEAIAALIPANTLTIASYLQSTPTANFMTAANASTKVVVLGKLKERVRRDPDTKKDVSYIMIEGQKAFIKKLDERHPFEPSATFNVDMYIENKVAETKKDENGDTVETGRYIITGLIPTYGDYVYRIPFVTSADNDVSEYVNDNYEKTQTANFQGYLVSASHREEVASKGWGTAQTQYRTTFTRERIITGGAPGYPKDSGDEGAISTEDIKEYLVNREARIEESESKTVRAQGSTGSGFGSVAGTAQPATATAPAASAPASNKPASDAFGKWSF